MRVCRWASICRTTRRPRRRLILTIPPLKLSRNSPARAFLLLIEIGHLISYAALFIWFSAVQRPSPPAPAPYLVLVVALVGSAFRIYLISAIAADFFGKGRLFRQMFPGMLVLDELWAASPLLLFPKLGYVTLLFVAGLAFLPFTQRKLMGWLCVEGSSKE